MKTFSRKLIVLFYFHLILLKDKKINPDTELESDGQLLHQGCCDQIKSLKRCASFKLMKL